MRSCFPSFFLFPFVSARTLRWIYPVVTPQNVGLVIRSSPWKFTLIDWPCFPVQRRSLNSSRSQIIIKRPAHIKTHPRSRQVNDLNESADAATTLSLSSQASTSSYALDSIQDTTDELSRIRAMLRPPPIPGVPDWGIPTASSVPSDPDIEASSFPVHEESISLSICCRRSFPDFLLWSEIPSTQSISTTHWCRIVLFEIHICMLSSWNSSTLTSGLRIFHHLYGTRMTCAMTGSRIE